MFQSDAGEAEDRLCTKCGFDPCPGLLEPPEEPAKLEKPASPKPETKPKEHRGKKSIRKDKSSHIMLKLIGGWLLVLALIIFGARHLWHTEEPESTYTPLADASTVTEEDTVFLSDSIQKCLTTFSGFLRSGSLEGQNQFVLSPISTARRAARFHSLNPTVKIDPKTLTVAGKSVIHLPETKAIVILWESKEGQQYDTMFREEKGEWRLDWDQFARFSDYPWSLFLAGSGPTEAEFRLLARERLAEERKGAETISLMLYAPRIGAPGETGFQSSEFLVSRKSRDGQLLEAAFKLARSGGQVFDSQLPNVNPDGLIRVRVKVRRTEADQERKFEITRVIACHWYSIDDPGVVPISPETSESEESSSGEN